MYNKDILTKKEVWSVIVVKGILFTLVVYFLLFIMGNVYTLVIQKMHLMIHSNIYGY